ncbi:universal stress protein [Phycicoccus sp. 3266]|uniref:universal stress protein n=1 Tax=Phycicoccus sp. 3266 TaxID=2817751 RepID=UPI002861605B|nr:universal stress protein [Phycicoccus sp. 3266]MDR6864814.1 nucleotide-binding universal stress UspA family protein [Phycicoccus sp. 3266]
MNAAPAPVVVGLDLSATSELAVDWGAAEAELRGCALELVHVAPPTALPAVVVSDTDNPHVYGDTPPLTLPHSRCEAVGARVRQAHPSLEVVVRVVPGADPAHTLVEESRHAAVLALGARGLGALRGMVLGSVSKAVTEHAHAPVVVVRHAASTTIPDPRVVVGVDGSEVSAPALRFAFEEARRRRVGVTAVHTWQPDVRTPSTEWWPADPIRDEADERAVASEAIAGFREEFPDVDVRVHVTEQDAVAELVRLSSGAGLLVVGSRGRGPVASAVLGSVSATVLRKAHCPVAVVHPEAGSRQVEGSAGSASTTASTGRG